MTSQKNIFERNPKKTLLIFCAVLFLLSDFLSTKVLNRSTVSKTIYGNVKVHHHGISPLYEADMEGYKNHTVYTDHFGFKSERKEKPPLKSGRHRILFIGDSFTEGVGLPYEETFVGIIDHALKKNADVFNAGVAGSSPSIYYSTIKYLMERQGFQFDEAVVYLDVGDIYEEALFRYLDGDIVRDKKRADRDVAMEIKYFLYFNFRGCFKLASLGRHYLWHPIQNALMPLPEIIEPSAKYRHTSFLGVENAMWTYSDEAWKRYGEKGLKQTTENMDQLYALLDHAGIPLSVAVYPWPDQIFYDTADSKMVTYWENWCVGKCRLFISHFSDFIGPHSLAKATISKYYIPHNVHFNEAGNQKIADGFLKAYRNWNRAGVQ